MTDVVEIVGAIVVVLGVGLIWVPAAVILAGLLLVVFSVMYARQGRDRVIGRGGDSE